MRLSDVLSKPPVSRFEQVNNFLGKTKLNCGKQRKVNIGIVSLTYFCKHCDDDMTFVSDNELFCIGINDYRVSIDCVLRCPRCGELVPVWFLEAVFTRAQNCGKIELWQKKGESRTRAT